MEGLSRLFAEALRLHRSETALRDARREIARRDSLALLGQLAGDISPELPARKNAPARRKLFFWLNGRGDGKPAADNGMPKASGSRHCTVLIASSRPAFQDAVRGALVSQERITVLDTADLDEEGILNARGTHPDVVVVDLSAAGMSGFRTITKIREQLPDTRVIAVSPYATKSIRYTARESGAHRLLLGDFQGRDLVDAIRGLMAAL
jgi:CheY-like chemotaxis protein